MVEDIVRSVEKQQSYRLKNYWKLAKNHNFFTRFCQVSFGQFGWNFDGPFGDVVAVCVANLIGI